MPRTNFSWWSSVAKGNALPPVKNEIDCTARERSPCVCSLSAPGAPFKINLARLWFSTVAFDGLSEKPGHRSWSGEDRVSLCLVIARGGPKERVFAPGWW
jgi:hypothetical protein